MLESLFQNPHAYLGLHSIEKGSVIRLYHPFKEVVFLEVLGEKKRLKRKSLTPLFEYVFPGKLHKKDYFIFHENGLKALDPYAFLPTFTKEDEQLFGKGVHETIYEKMGGRLIEHEGVFGVKFVVWAPCAKYVCLIGDFNGWHEKIMPMRLMGASGVFELFVPGLKEREKYKFFIVTKEGKGLYKADPYAFQGEMRPKTASIVTSVEAFAFSDYHWMAKRKKRQRLSQPINIYEVHLSSWKLENKNFLNYRVLAPYLATYCKKMGYTHVELMPVTGHPLDESWGYQVSGFYAVSSRFGLPCDFQYLVDYLHREEIGVFIDWVPGHFPNDDHSLACFDGTYLYEHEDPRKGYHPDWNTHIFNYGRFEVANFLLGSAFFFLDKMHIDGLRVDAISSMVYLDYGRKKGAWIPNEKGGNRNLEAIAFLRNLTKRVHKKFPGVFLMAEESHAFPKVTRPISEGGLGFDLKWDLGWMHDTLSVFKEKEKGRKTKSHLFSYEMSYFYDEQYMLTLSHDEVVHEKKSLILKMPGNEWEKFANLRLLFSYMMGHPGKKLLFMGGEFGQWHEWDCMEEIHWGLLQFPFHKKLQRCVCDLNHFYLSHPALYERDFDPLGFKWISLFPCLSYIRFAKEETLLIAHNFSSSILEKTVLPFKEEKKLVEIFNTDAQEYGGYGIIDPEITLEEKGISLTLAPLSTKFFRLDEP